MGRRPFAVAFAFVSLFAYALAPCARAGDDVPAEDETGFGYSNEDVAIADAGLSDGFKVATGAEADALAKSTKESLAAFVKEKGAGEALDGVAARVVACPEGGLVAVGLIDLNQRSEPLEKALAEAAAAKGWTVKPLGTPKNWIVASGAEAPRAKVVAAQIAYAAQMLATKSSSAAEDRNPQLAGAMARIAYRIDPKNARANMMSGSFLFSKGMREEDKAMMDEGIARFRAALAKDATGSLTPREATSLRGELGGAILQKGGPSTEARDLLKEAVKTIDVVSREAAIDFRYNLACAHGRLKELDEAFPLLEKALADNAKDPVEGISHWRKDPDFESLKGDPRWAKLLTTYPEPPESPHGTK